MSMIDHHDEPLWVGMDVDAELARLAEEDRRRDGAGPSAPRGARRSRAARVLRAASSAIGRGAMPRFPLQA
ncbi:MAG TPA: hypothetical protein VHA80_12870 [Solirubrobacterales bacterium]|nr:hypothetical protein [Solirubrobacterales bacterium]